MIHRIAILIAGTFLTPSAPAEAQLARHEFSQIEMGVRFKIALYAPDEATANKAAQAAFERIGELNRIMSDYDPHSELMRLCRTSALGRPVKVSPELLYVLSRSLELSRRTDGAFDVTVGPLVKLWRRARRRKEFPDPDRLAAARELVGYQSVRIDNEAGTVELLKEGMRLDLGGIAKGYAADEALRVLKKHGVTRALIDASGDITIGDPPPDKKGWRIAIAPLPGREKVKPRSGSPPLHGGAGGGSRIPDIQYLILKNTAVATSGDAFQHVVIDGKRYSHIINPKTGLGLMTPGSVTVIAPDGTTADSLASAVSVLGPQRGLRLIESTKGTAALIVQLNEGQMQVFASKGVAKVGTSREP